MIDDKGKISSLVVLALWSLLARAEELRAKKPIKPNYWGCLSEVAKSFEYCNPSLSYEKRLDALLNELTLAEKVAAISPDPTKELCETHTKGVPRIGLPPYMWLVETNTAVASACLAENKCSTQFSGPMSIAASFNRTSWYLKGSVFGTEQRALVNINGERATTSKNKRYIGLNAFGPNINQQRDPRFGRSSELPGEDPYLAGQYATNMVKGMQEQDSNGYPKVLAYLKHFTGYSREETRGHDTYKISQHDLFDTYLPQFEVAMKEGKATGVMCSYNGINGSPMCANGYLLNHILRKKWNRPDAHVTTDCDAITFLVDKPAFAPTNETGAAWALNNGSDVEMGSTNWNQYLVNAIELGLTTEAAVDRAFSRSYLPHFRAGRFDDPTISEWSRFGYDDVNSERHQAIQIEASLQGLVLLKNEQDLLPLEAGKQRIAVLGPMCQTRAGLMSDYENDQSCYGGGHSCIPTIAESIQALSPNLTTSAGGVEVNSDQADGIPEALILAQEADVIVLCLGITKDEEHEGIDRDDIFLPGLQESFAIRVLEVGKPIVMVLVNGGQVAIDNLVEKSTAIVEAFNPNSIGGKHIAMTLFGLENRWGKLPYTIYPHEAIQAFDMADHSMSTPPGRTHRYFTGEPIFRFGSGLSYTQFKIQCAKGEHEDEHKLTFVCLVTNIGPRAGDEVLQFYHSAGSNIRRKANHPIPVQTLIDFKRVSTEAGATEKSTFTFDEEEAFLIVNKNGERVLYPGDHEVIITNGAGHRQAFHVMV